MHVEPANIDSKVVLGYFLKVVDCLKRKYHAHTLQDFLYKVLLFYRLSLVFSEWTEGRKMFVLLKCRWL